VSKGECHGVRSIVEAQSIRKIVNDVLHCSLRHEETTTYLSSIEPLREEAEHPSFALGENRHLLSG